MEQILSQSERLVLETASLIKKTGSIFPWKRKSAEKELQARSEELFEPLLILFQKEIVQYRKKYKSVTFSTILLIAISIAFSIIEIGLVVSRHPINDSFWVSAAIFTLITPAFISIYGKSFKNHKLLAKALSKYHDLRIIGPMAEAICFDHKTQSGTMYSRHNDSETALRNSLQLINSQNDVHLTAYQVACLTSVLKFNKHYLCLAVLQAVPYFGNSEALGVVRRLSKRRVSNWNWNIVNAAKDCLPSLEARVARLNVAETLLRPSSISEVGGETLLRPVIQSSDSAPEELLRASLGE